MRNTAGFAPLAMAALLALTGCTDDDDDDVASDAGIDASVDAGPSDGGIDGGATQPVTIRFKAKVGARDLVCGETYDGQGLADAAVRAAPQDFRFYVEEVRLIGANGAEQRVVLDDRGSYQTRDLALVDFADARGECVPAKNNTTITGKVPPGDYRGVVLVIGVPEQLNHILPTQGPAPLQAPGAFWDWNVGYRFVMAELAQVPEATLDGGLTADGGLPGYGVFHLGSFGCSGTPPAITCTRANRAVVRLPSFNPATNQIVADLGAFFTNVDLTKQVACHGVNPANCAAPFEAVGVDLDAGVPLPSQRVFRVE